MANYRIANMPVNVTLAVDNTRWQSRTKTPQKSKNETPILLDNFKNFYYCVENRIFDFFRSFLIFKKFTIFFLIFRVFDFI